MGSDLQWIVYSSVTRNASSSYKARRLVIVPPGYIYLGCRLDGRSEKDYRPVEVMTGILNHSAGSARVKLMASVFQGGTSVVSCVTIEIGSPSFDQPHQGRLIIDVEWQEFNVASPTATPKFSGKSGSEIADSLKATLSSAFTPGCLPLELLCIQPGKQCWVLYVDLLLLESDGNLLDAASLAIVAAVRTLKLPSSLSSKIPDGNLSTKNVPLFVTVHKIGNAFVVDATREEEACSLSRCSRSSAFEIVVTFVLEEQICHLLPHGVFALLTRIPLLQRRLEGCDEVFWSSLSRVEFCVIG
ncbi:unnamed protein product [Schistocephalus solidus]|uniref:Ribosomal RNA-processing protein 42 n=1 Tax=Schistocephalus solidus TaxID=70667 RepID=A0A183T033_SCHSO|nr:unnamed protein product [Schistocephalus solidus]